MKNMDDLRIKTIALQNEIGEQLDVEVNLTPGCAYRNKNVLRLMEEHSALQNVLSAMAGDTRTLVSLMIRQSSRALDKSL